MGDDTQTVRSEIVELIPSLRAFARSLTRNTAEADDLLQESLTKALARIHQFTPGTNLKAWLMKIERNTFYTAYNRKKLEPVAPVEDFPSISTEPTQEWSLRLRAVDDALQQIPEPQRDALVLVGGAGLSYEEAADVCGCAMGTIKSRVNRARTMLKDLTDSGEIEEAPPIEQLHARSA